MAQGPMQLTGIVEADETYVGGPCRRRVGRPGPNDGQKTAVMALVERGGRVRAFRPQSAGVVGRLTTGTP